MSHKALSALVVTIVLVAFAIAAGLIVFSFSAGLVKFQTTSVSTQAVCAQKGALFLDSAMCTRVRDSSLVGYWKLDSVNASNYTPDSIINHNDGKLYNGSVSCFNLTGCINLTAGQINSGLQFDGADDYVDAGNASSLNITGDLTLSAWIKINGGTANTIIGTKTGGINDFNNMYRLTNGGGNTVVFRLGNGTALHDAESDITLSNNVWYHVAGTVSGVNMTVYINGVAAANHTFVGTRKSTLNKVTIGASSITVADKNFNGTIDDVRIYNRSLSAQEISDHYQKGLEKFAADGYFKTIKASVRNIGTTPLSNLTVFADINGRLYQNNTPLNGGATLPAASEPLTLEAYTYYDGPIKTLKVSVLNCPISTTLSNASATVGTC